VSECVMSTASTTSTISPASTELAGSLREVVLAGPGARRAVPEDVAAHPLRVLASPARVRAAVAAGTEAVPGPAGTAGPPRRRTRSLPAVVTTVLVLGLCLFSGEGYGAVLARLWPLLGWLHPALLLGPVVSAPALSQARARLPVGVLRAIFQASAEQAAALLSTPALSTLPGVRVFGLLATAVDGTVFDLAGTDDLKARYATPAGGRYPQARVVTLIACGTRQVLAAESDSIAVSEQRLWDRLVGHLKPGTINLADRNFFSMHRWHIAAATGAHLIWRVKNGVNSLPATVIETMSDGSQRVRLRESDGMLSRRRKTTGEKTAPRLDDITARLVEFTVTVTDEAGRARTSRFRVLTTLLDPDAYPAEAIAACYARRWQVELVYKTIKSTLRGVGRRLRGQTPDLAEQELWGLLAVYNALAGHAVATAVDLAVDPHEISFTAVLRATRDHLTAGTAACPGCGRHATPADLHAVIAAAPRNRTDRQRTAPRTAKDRQTEHARNVTYTITIEESNLPRAA